MNIASTDYEVHFSEIWMLFENINALNINYLDVLVSASSFNYKILMCIQGLSNPCASYDSGLHVERERFLRWNLTSPHFIGCHTVMKTAEQYILNRLNTNYFKLGMHIIAKYTTAYWSSST